jgi:hypothetical protein
MAKHTGQPLEKIAFDTERDYFMSGEEAKKYGLIDEVISRPPKAVKEVVKDAGDRLRQSRMLKKVIQHGRRERGPRGVARNYVEGNERLRTPLGGFFGILPGRRHA